MEDSFRSKGSYSRSQYSESTSSDLMKQLSSDHTLSSNSSKKSKKSHHTPKLDSKSFYPVEADDPRDVNNQQANYVQNQPDDFYDKNGGNVYRQPPPRFAQNQNYQYQNNNNRNYNNKNYHHHNNNNNYYPPNNNNYQQRNQQNWNQNYGNNYNNNYQNNNNYHNHKNYQKFSKGSYPKHHNPSEYSESSDTLSNKILIDISYEEPTNHNKTQAVAKKFNVDPNLVGYNEGEEEKDEEDTSLGYLLESFTTENEKETDSKGVNKKGSKQKFTFQGVGVELHNILENKLTIMKMKIELPCSECTFLTYQILAKKNAVEPWIFKAKRCRFCLESSKNVIQVRYNKPVDWEDNFSNGQLTLGRIETKGVLAEKVTINNIREISFQYQCAACKKEYPITCIQYKDSEDFLIDENMSCNSWNCYKLMMIRIKKIQLNKINKPEKLNSIAEAADSIENPDEESIIHCFFL